jgi:hypothetical protein
MAVQPPAVSPPIPSSPPPPPPTPTRLGNKPLLKIGLHKPAINYLTALLNFKLLNRAWRLFDCGGTQSLVLALWEGDVFNPTSGLTERCRFYEAPDQLIEIPASYNLLCNLEYMLGGHPLITGSWMPFQLDPAYAWDQKTGEYSWPKSPGTNILGTTVWTYNAITPPGPYPAPMPSPALDSDIALLWTSDGTSILGYVRFHKNLDNTLNFNARIFWTCTNQTPCIFTFPVPSLADGKSFLPTAFVAQQALSASVAPTADTNISRLTTSAWTSGAGTFTITFEKNNIP